MDFFKQPLYKSRTDRKIEGVCGGLSKALRIDSSWIRLFWAILVIAGGTGILAYIILAIVLDYEPTED